MSADGLISFVKANPLAASACACAAAASLGYVKKYFAGGVNPHVDVKLQGKTAVITGANTGIGRETGWSNILDTNL